jgi:hypothetical protein
VKQSPAWLRYLMSTTSPLALLTARQKRAAPTEDITDEFYTQTRHNGARRASSASNTG